MAKKKQRTEEPVLLAGWALLFVLFVSFVCVAEIGPVPGNSGGSASSGAIRGRSEGGKRQKTVA